MQQFSSAYDPRIYEFFFTRQTGNTDDDIVLAHQKYEPDTPLEIVKCRAITIIVMARTSGAGFDSPLAYC